jgi:hypothetical protein
MQAFSNLGDCQVFSGVPRALYVCKINNSIDYIGLRCVKLSAVRLFSRLRSLMCYHIRMGTTFDIPEIVQMSNMYSPFGV